MKLDIKANSLAGLFKCEPDELLDLMHENPRVHALVLLATYLNDSPKEAEAIMISTSLIIDKDIFNTAELIQYWDNVLTKKKLLRLANLLC